MPSNGKHHPWVAGGIQPKFGTLVKGPLVPVTESLPRFRAGSANPSRYLHSHCLLQPVSRFDHEIWCLTEEIRSKIL